jgi:superfamily I DNA/RNA helicase/Zn-dependent peptidase ImmA (M78 family)
MNPFERARTEAVLLRSELIKLCNSSLPTSIELLKQVEDALDLAIEKVPSTFSALGGGSAVLNRLESSIYIRNDIEDGQFAYLLAHELGHWILDAEKNETTIASLAAITKSDGTPATLKIEAYGVHERQELQANVFARELLIPRILAKQLWDAGKGATEISKMLFVPLEIVRQQMLDAVLLPILPESPIVPPPVPSVDQLTAAKAPEKFVNVVAGPGTGKTTTLVQRVKYLIEVENVSANKILVLTFTNKAAFELVERLRHSGLKTGGDIWAGTFHAFGLDFFRKYHQIFKLPADLGVADTLQEISLLVKKLPELTLRFYQRLQDPYEWLKEVIDCIHRLKEELIDPLQFEQRISQYPAASEELQRQREDIASLYRALEGALHDAGMVSMSDLVMRTAITLRDKRSEVAHLADHFEHVLVDEYQDVSESMVVLVRQLIKNARSLWVVGDVRQAVYHWRGASVKSLLKFEQSFKAHHSQTAKKYPLDCNRRSSSEIVALFSHVGRRHILEQELPLDQLIAFKGASGLTPELVSCSSKAAIAPAILSRILADKHAGVSYRDQAVLCRGTPDVEYIARYLRDAGIPVFYIGDIVHRQEVKKFLCLMQLLVEREPKALIGLANDNCLSLPIEDIRYLIEQSKHDRDFQRGRWLYKSISGLTPSAMTGISNIGVLLKGFTRMSSPWDLLCHLILELRFGLPNSIDQSIEAQTQKIAIWQFIYSVRNGDGDGRRVNLSRYLLRQQLRQRIGESYTDRQLPAEANAMDAVRVLTVHGSKGLEFESVHLGYVNAGSFSAAKPTWNFDDSIEDILTPEILGSTEEEFERENAVERNNLLYVALSRAKLRLHLYENIEFGVRERPPQFQNLPSKICQTIPFHQPSAPRPPEANTPVRQQSLTFEEFETYVRCPRQYYYRHRLQLVPENELDVAIRARRAINQTLLICAKGGEASSSFEITWDQNKLPSYSEDPGLYSDAVEVCNKGLALITSVAGPVIEGAVAHINGLSIILPWVIHSPHAGIRLIRFSSRGAAKSRDLLRPMLLNAPNLPATAFTLNTLISQREFEVPISKAPDKTVAHKSSIGLMAEDFSPIPSKVCGRCAFSTICPGMPKPPSSNGA